MAGLYFHIPYCKQACTYCNFHFSTIQRSTSDMVEAMLIELEQRSVEFQFPLETIYFGGGTPSILDPKQIDKLLNASHRFFDTTGVTEITLEANPDDLHAANLQAWQQSGINRLSLGIQTLDSEELFKFNRSHNAEQAKAAVALSLNAGIRSINIDLIFGSPWLSDAQWKQNLDWAFNSGADHISAYALTLEPKTLMNKKVSKREWPSIEETKQAEHYKILHECAEKNCWDFYEISNLSKPGHRAKHNSNYWNNKPYLGIGPSAHSYTQKTRSWNVADNKKYIEHIQNGKYILEFEQLSSRDHYNEYVLTNIRTKEGLDINKLESWGLKTNLEIEIEMNELVERGLLVASENSVFLNLEGRLLADWITSRLMVE